MLNKIENKKVLGIEEGKTDNKEELIISNTRLYNREQNRGSASPIDKRSDKL